MGIPCSSRKARRLAKSRHFPTAGASTGFSPNVVRTRCWTDCHRAAGLTHWFAGDYAEARMHLERALTRFQPGRDDDLAFRFGNDAGVAAMFYLALTLWPLGYIARAVFLIGEAGARSAGLAHIATRAHGKVHVALFELMHGDPLRAASNAAELATLTREHDLPLWRAFGVFLQGLASAQSAPTS